MDLVVGLDLSDLGRLTDAMLARGWRQDQRREHRWVSPQGVRIDLLPAGERARRNRRLDWPLAETRMSLIGFNHVFTDAVERDLAAGLTGSGCDLSTLCAEDDERAIVNRFLEVIQDPAAGLSDWPLSDGPHSARERFAGESRALGRGWTMRMR